MTSEPRTPSTPQSLAQLRDDILENHGPHDRRTSRGFTVVCLCGRPWPCQDPAYRLATLLSVENVAAGLCDAKLVREGFRHWEDNHEQDAIWFLEAIGASHD